MTDPELHRLFHRLWTKAVGTPDYVKAEWIEFESKLQQIERIKSQSLRPGGGNASFPQESNHVEITINRGPLDRKAISEAFRLALKKSMDASRCWGDVLKRTAEKTAVKD